MTLLEMYYGFSGLGFSIGLFIIGMKYRSLDKKQKKGKI